MKPTIILTTLLIACLNVGLAANMHTTIIVHQSTTNHSNQLQSSSFKVLNGVERNETDTTGKEERAIPKSKPKKHVVAKVLLGLTATFVIVFILVASSGNFMRMM
jgi:hypothetical protein